MKKIDRRKFLKLGGSAAAYGALVYFGLTGCSVFDGLGRETDGDGGGRKSRLKVGYLPLTDHLTIIALSRLQFQKIKVEPVKYASWPELAEALRAGVIDAGFALTPIGLELRQNDVPLKAVLLGHRNGSVLTVRANQNIRNIEDLRGRKIAIPSRFSTHNVLLRKLLSDNNIPSTAVTIIEMAPPEMVQALAGKQIDAFIVAEPFGGQAEMQQVGEVFLLSKDIWADHACCVLNVNEAAIERDREAIQELVDALVDTGAFIEKNPTEAAELSRSYLGQSPAVIEHVLTNPKDRVTFDYLIPLREDFSQTQDLLNAFGITKNRVDLDDYLDDSFARKAYR